MKSSGRYGIRYCIGIVTCSVLLFCNGCGSQSAESKGKATNQVDNVLNQQIQAAADQGDSQNNQQSTLYTEEQGDKKDEGTVSQEMEKENGSQTSGTPSQEENKTYEYTDIDIDMTEFGSDLIYATIYQMMTDPDSYIGKTIRIEGMYYSSWYEETNQNYYYVLIQDAMACCSQGIEFIWGDDTHVYPDEYPSETTEVIVTGVFETYTEQGDPNLYCRLANAELGL